MVNANTDTICIPEAQNAVVTVMPPSLLGDVNEDSVVDTIDALLTAQYYVGLSVANFNPSYADVNSDGSCYRYC